MSIIFALNLGEFADIQIFAAKYKSILIHPPFPFLPHLGNLILTKHYYQFNIDKTLLLKNTHTLLSNSPYSNSPPPSFNDVICSFEGNFLRLESPRDWEILSRPYSQ